MLPPVTATPPDSLVTTAHVVYALHTLSLVIGAFGTASIVGAFVFGWPSIIAVIINYVKRDDVRGTWLDSHFSWQIRTFWIALLASVLVLVLSAPLMLVIVGFATAIAGFFIIGVWVIYRVLRGWLALRDVRTLPV